MNIKETLKEWAIKFGCFFFLIAWFMNLVGTTAYIFWASTVLQELGEIESGFGLFGFLNLILSACFFPQVRKVFKTLIGKTE